MFLHLFHFQTILVISVQNDTQPNAVQEYNIEYKDIQVYDIHIQQNAIQDNNIQHHDTQHNGIQNNDVQNDDTHHIINSLHIVWLCSVLFCKLSFNECRISFRYADCQAKHPAILRNLWFIMLYNGTARFKNVNNPVNTNIYSYLETSVGQSSNLCLNAVRFFNTSVNQTSVYGSLRQWFSCIGV